MKILALESSAKTSSVALLENEHILARFSLDVGFTHSQTLMPMVDAIFKGAQTTPKDIDVFAVSYGPGSFTGIRIGVSTVKGLSFAHHTPVIGISTLEAMAYTYVDIEDTCFSAVMDARNQQVYTAQFLLKQGKVHRLTEDAAMRIEDLPNLWRENNMGNVLCFGDGAQLVFDILKNEIPSLRIAPEQLRTQNAIGVARAAYQKGETAFIAAENLEPVYLRLPQAVRELRSKKKGE